MTLEPEHLAFAEEQLGRIDEARFCGWDHADSNVWEIYAGEPAARYFLKVHVRARKFAQEKFAYEHWTTQIANTSTQAKVPQCLAAADGALLLSALPGRIPSHHELTAEHLRTAGRFLRDWHKLPNPIHDPMPLDEAVASRCEAWCERAGPHLAFEEIQWVRNEIESAIPELASAERVPTHGDYTPRNWLVAGDGSFGVIDFEHAKANHWLFDLNRLHAGLFTERPELLMPFWEGYGRDLTPSEDALQRKLAALDALCTVVWARQHADEAFEALGIHSLQRLRKASSS